MDRKIKRKKHMIKISDILNAKESIRKLSDTTYSNFKVARAISKLFKEISNEIDFFNEELKKLIDQYGQKDSNGKLVPSSDGGIKINQKDIDEFNSKYKDLLDLDVSNNIETISISETDFSNKSIIPSPYEMTILEPFINWKD
jgi:hypothetical protein